MLRRRSASRRLGIVLGVLLVLSTAAPATAAPIVFGFGGSNSLGTVGNSRVYTVDGLTVTTTAWGHIVFLGFDFGFLPGALGRWSAGLGDCNAAELFLLGCGNGPHQVDNKDLAPLLYAKDFVLFQFSQPVDLLSAFIRTTDGSDLDVTYWAGDVTLPGDLLQGETYSTLNSLGFESPTTNNYSGSSTSRTVPLTGNNSVNALLFGARVDHSNDAFKITSLSVQRSVPEPGSLLLLGLALMGLGSRLRRRR